MNIRVTHHAKRRFKQRVGLPARAVRKAAEEAFYHGTPLEELPPPVAEKLGRMADRHSQGHQTKVTIFRDHPFCFVWLPSGPARELAPVLMTVLPTHLTPEKDNE